MKRFLGVEQKKRHRALLKDVNFWQECLKQALKNNDTTYAMYCDEMINKLKNK